MSLLWRAERPENLLLIRIRRAWSSVTSKVVHLCPHLRQRLRRLTSSSLVGRESVTSILVHLQRGQSKRSLLDFVVIFLLLCSGCDIDVASLSFAYDA